MTYKDTPAAQHLRAMREQHGADSPQAKAAFDARMAEVMGAKLTDAVSTGGLYMMSFVDQDKSAPLDEQVPGGGGWLGTCVIYAIGLVDAIKRSHALGINPGGEVAAVGPLPADAIGPEWRDRLLTKAEVDAIPEPEW